jgi:hypothetical protein
MGRHSDIVQMLEHIFGDAIVEHALAFDHLVLLGVESGGVVLEVLNQRSRLRALIEDFRLAFVDSATAAHWGVPWFLKVHRRPWLLLSDLKLRDPRLRNRGRDVSANNPAPDRKLVQWSASRNRARFTLSTPFVRAATLLHVALTEPDRYARRTIQT